MIVGPFASQVALYGVCGLFLAAALSDLRSLIIPNRYPIAIALLYPAYVLAAGHAIDWPGGLMVAGGTFAVGLALFALRLTGGGDVKLLTAIALWAGPGLILPFFLVTALAGGVLAILLMLRHRLALFAVAPAHAGQGTQPEKRKQPLPYGVPIAVGGLYVTFTLLGLT